MKKHLPYSVVIAVSLVAVTASTLLTPSDREAGDSPEIRYIAAGMRSNRDKFQSFKARISRELIAPKAYLESQRESINEPNSPVSPVSRAQLNTSIPRTGVQSVEEIDIVRQAPLLSIQRQTPPNEVKKLRAQRLVADAKRIYVLEEYDEQKGQAKKVNDQSGVYRFGYIHPRVTLIKDDLVQGWEYADPRSYAYFRFPGGPALDELFANPEHPSAFKGEEEVDGAVCMHVETRLAEDFIIDSWIDAEHGFIVRRLEERMGEKLLLFRQVIVPKIQESKGIWAPAVVEIRQFTNFPSVAVGGTPQVDPETVVLSRISISGFDAEPSTLPSQFSIRWPDKTNVRDLIEQRAFVVGAQTQSAKSTDRADPGSLKVKKVD